MSPQTHPFRLRGPFLTFTGRMLTEVQREALIGPDGGEERPLEEGRWVRSEED